MSQLSSTNAQYQPIPQIVDDNNDTNDEIAIEPPPIHRVDSRIHWVHFIFGCAVLLPWNGTYTPFNIQAHTHLLFSIDNCDSLLPLSHDWLISQVFIQLISVHNIHPS